MHRHFLASAIVVCFCAPSLGGDVRTSPPASSSAVVTRVATGDTFDIDRRIEGAARVKLAGIQAPRRSVGPPDLASWPLAEEARDALASLVLGRGVVLEPTGPGTDRHGRLVAQAYRDDGTWIQGELLARGLARVFTFADNHARAAEMLAIEESARKRGLGLWGDPFYAVRAPGNAGRDIGSFQVIEGRVVKAARVKNHVYLNFGADWRTDFTVSARVRDLPRFADSGLDLLSLGGRDIRVRGWLKDYGGPMIDATHPEQIEVLGPETPYPEPTGGPDNP